MHLHRTRRRPQAHSSPGRRYHRGQGRRRRRVSILKVLNCKTRHLAGVLPKFQSGMAAAPQVVFAMRRGMSPIDHILSVIRDLVREVRAPR